MVDLALDRKRITVNFHLNSQSRPLAGYQRFKNHPFITPLYKSIPSMRPVILAEKIAVWGLSVCGGLPKFWSKIQVL
ncbi:MAG: hypothetical protein ACJAUL_000318 [Paraglaciecola sp.]|jgi:hypothetical protein